MRAVVITHHGPPEVLQVQERPDPAPGEGEVLIEVAAAGINFADTMARVGLYPDAPKPPCVVGYEVAGTVAGGRPRRRWRRCSVGHAGDRPGPLRGYAELAVARADGVVADPRRLSFEPRRRSRSTTPPPGRR